MSNLKDQLIRLGHEKPELRDHLRPILDTLKTARTSQEHIGELEDLLERADNYISRLGYKLVELAQRNGRIVAVFEDMETSVDYSLFFKFTSSGKGAQIYLEKLNPRGGKVKGPEWFFRDRDHTRRGEGKFVAEWFEEAVEMVTDDRTEQTLFV